MILYRHMCGHCGFKFWVLNVGPVYHCPNCGELQCVAIAADTFNQGMSIDKDTAKSIADSLKETR